MIKNSAGILLAGLAVVAAVGFVACQPAPPPAKLDAITATISFNGTTCSIQGGAVNIKSTQQVMWVQQQLLSFQVDFPSETAFNTGTPFTVLPSGPWVGTFPAPAGSSVTTPPAKRNNPFVKDYPIETITVDNKVCYDRRNNPIQNMKVHVD